MEARRILVVDDDPDLRRISQITLQAAGMEVTAAPSGSEALRMLETLRPDAILLDVMMPGMDGPACLERLRGRPETRHIPVVFVTAQTQPHEIARFLSLGALGVIKKPFDPLRFAGEVSSLLKAGRP